MNDDRQQRVVDYLIGEMSPGEAAGFEREMEADLELAGMVDEMRPVVSRLEALPDEAWDQPAPPALVLPAGHPAESAAKAPSDPAGFAEQSAGTPETSEAGHSGRATRSRSWWQAGFTWPRLATGLATGFALLAVGFFAGTLTDDGGSGSGLDPGAQPSTTVAMDSLGEAPAGASGEVSLTSSGEDPATVTVDGLKPSPNKEFYEVWLLGDEGELISLGSFRVGADGESRIEVPLPVNPEKYKYFDVSIQPENGSPDHSGRSVLRGPTSKA
ncbi:MAG: anti-sigma factor [Thermoleophilia bacterium]|nr:anti-sigma factor [Thermoleophilia bacterium]